MQPTPTISSHGDLGDVCCLMACAKALGKASILVSNSPICKPITAPERFNAIAALVRSQPYIERFDVWHGEPIDYDAASFREHGIPFGMNLARVHARHAGIEISEEPWLDIEPADGYSDKIILNRSTRHQSDLFPWSQIVGHFKPEDMVFIGLREEWTQFVNEFGVKVGYQPTKDLLECAQIIKGSKLLIANQSANVNSCIGMGHPFVLECSLTSVDVVYKRANGIYVVDGEMELSVEGYDTLKTKPQIPEREIDFTLTPPHPGLWFYETRDGVLHKNVYGRALVRGVNDYERKNNLPLSRESDFAVQMNKRFPTFGGGGHANWLYDRIAVVKEIIKKKQEEE